MIDRRVRLALGLIALFGASRAEALESSINRGPLADFLDVFSEQAIPKQVVIWRHPEYEKGTVVVSTKERRLYYVLSDDRAIEYGVGVGREGFTWSGEKTVSRKREWPDWRPPAVMLKRRPDLPRHMEGEIDNPLGRAPFIWDRAITGFTGRMSRKPWAPPFPPVASA